MTTIRYAVKVVVQHRQWLETLDEALWVIVEDDALVQQAIRVEYGLQFLHRLVSLLAPLIFHKGSHVAARSMLSFQRAVVLFNHQFGHVAHHLCITVDLSLLGKALVQDKMVVALESVTIDAGIAIAVVGN